jgi:hypothetical protein
MRLKTARFIVEDELFIFDINKIPVTSLLYTLIYNKYKNTNKIVGDTVYIQTIYDVDEFQIVYDCILGNISATEENQHILDYFCIDLTESYEFCLIHENNMRKNMYNLDYVLHYMNTNKYYGLNILDQAKWYSLKVGIPSIKNLLFDFVPLNKNKWIDIQIKLNEFGELITALGGNCLIAGGKIFTALFNNGNVYDIPTKHKNERNDVDIFIYGCTQKEAESKIVKLAKYLSITYKKNGYSLKLVRTKNAFTIQVYRQREYAIDYQIILRLYKSPSEILHGFDVDSCCMGYDGENILFTNRCMYSLLKGYNTVNFERLSPSYEFRLAKYGTRGVAIHIPNFNKSKVNQSKLEAYHEYTKYEDSYNKEVRSYFECKDLKGLSRLLYLEYRYELTKHKHTFLNEVVKLNEVSSDYSSEPHTTPLQHGNQIMNIFFNYLDYVSDPRRYLRVREKLIAFLKIYNFDDYVPEILEELLFLDTAECQGMVWYQEYDRIKNNYIVNTRGRIINETDNTFTNFNYRGNIKYSIIAKMVKDPNNPTEFIITEYPILKENAEPKNLPLPPLLNNPLNEPEQEDENIYNILPQINNNDDEVDTDNSGEVNDDEVDDEVNDDDEVDDDEVNDDDEVDDDNHLQNFNAHILPYINLPTRIYRDIGININTIIDDLLTERSIYGRPTDVIHPSVDENTINAINSKLNDEPSLKMKFYQYFITNTFGSVSRRNYNGPQNNTFNFLNINLKFKEFKINYIEIYINLMLHLPQDLWDFLNCIKPVEFTADITFKTTNPGEQMTNTFNSIVLDNPDIWYNTDFYDNSDDKKDKKD